MISSVKVGDQEWQYTVNKERKSITMNGPNGEIAIRGLPVLFSPEAGSVNIAAELNKPNFKVDSAAVKRYIRANLQ